QYPEPTGMYPVTHPDALRSSPRAGGAFDDRLGQSGGHDGGEQFGREPARLFLGGHDVSVSAEQRTQAVGGGSGGGHAGAPASSANTSSAAYRPGRARSSQAARARAAVAGPRRSRTRWLSSKLSPPTVSST